MTRSDVAKALTLAAWLWLPSLAVLTTEQLQNAADIFALLAFSLLVLASPLVLIPRVRIYFLLWTPLALLVLPYSYLTFVYSSVPGDAMLASALHTSWSTSTQVLASFGWRIWLVPLGLIAYVWLALTLSRQWQLSVPTRKGLLAVVLVSVSITMVARLALPQQLNLPPLLEQSTLNLAFPSGLAMSLSRLARHETDNGEFASVHGRPATGAGPQPLLVVLVIGESLRADHLGINGYARNTTPQLAALGPELLTFPDVASTANWTNHAMPAIVSLPADNAENAGNARKQRASVLQTFGEAGYRTAWLSNQERTSFSRGADVVEHAVNSQDNHLRTDANLLPLMTSFVRQAGPRQFVVLHMIGSHIPYEERYSAASRVYRPTLRELGIDAPLPADRAAAINSYDNTVVEIDRFLARVIDVLRAESRPAVMLYTSDHGENLFDDERHLFMHAQTGPTRHDTHVPLLVWMNAPYRNAHPAIEQSLRANRQKRIGHAAMFPTLLEMGAVGWDGNDPSHSFASRLYIERQRNVMIDALSTTPYESLR